MKTRTPKLSPAQIAYATAKALVETLQSQCAAEFSAAGLFCTPEMGEDDWVRVYEAQEAIQARLGLNKATNALRAAEKALIDWAAGIVKRRGHYALVAPAFEEAPKNVAVRQELVDLCFKLSA